MSFGFGFGLPSWKTLSGGFTPASLFTQGEQGAWYDPSDLSTMFNDAAGTQPITSFTTNQPVGLLLDKSKGLVLGPELVTNGDFSSGTTGWTAGNASISTPNSALTVTNTGAVFGYAYQLLTVTGNCRYVVTGTFTKGTANTGALKIGTSLNAGNVASQSLSASGTFSFQFSPAGNSVFITFENSNQTNATGTIDNISVRELPGNHATASGSARPVLSKRYNLLERTEDFSNAYWTKTNLTIASGVIDPNGGSTAFTFTAGAVNATISRNIGSLPAGGVISCFIRRRTGSGAIGLWTGSLYTNITVTSAWQRVSVLQTSLTTGYFDLRISTSGDEVDVWHPDVRRGIDANAFQPAYQRVVTATDYDGDGFLPYLEYSGAQAMATGSIDFSAGDKMSVWAGVTKLSDAAGGVIVELTNSSLNAGAFSLFAGSPTATRSYSWSTASPQSFIGSSQFPAPSTVVDAALLDRAGTTAATEIFPRLNGAPATLSETVDGNPSGNFANAPLYIGARNAASLFFNGRQYSLIVRGAQSSDAQISATESWINQRTGAY